MNIYFKILKYAGSLRKFILPFTLFSLIAGVFGVLNMVLLKPLMDILFGQISQVEISKLANTPVIGYNILDWYQQFFAKKLLLDGKLSALQFVCFSIIVVTLIANVARYFSMRLLEAFKVNMVANLREAVFNNVLRLDLGFFTNEKKGDLISRITTDVQEVENSIANTFSAAIKELILLISYVVALLYISWQLTLFSLIVIPITGAFLGIMLKRMRHDAGAGQQRLSNLLSIMDEALGSMRIIKAFKSENYISNKFKDENQAYKHSIFNYAQKRELANPFSEFISICMVAGLLYFGGSLILNNQSGISASMFVSYIALFSQVVRPAKDISNAISSAQRGLVSGQRVLELLELKPKIENKGTKPAIFKSNIELENIGFQYNTDKKILENINITIPKGKTLALVGASGGGKSTIADILLRFYEPNAGHIKVDDILLQEIDLNQWHNLIGVVSQEPILFNDSIANNIKFGRDFSEEEIINAAKIANADEFITKLKEGYESNIGDRGSKLSGGQKQRLSIARAILQNPDILILDEATSALDTESERLVQTALTNLMQNRTSLIIAHRLSTIQSADYIYVINNGKVVEEGNHQQLIADKEGYYTKLVNMQEIGRIDL